MSTEFKPNDRVSINKDLTYTAPRFGTAKDMRTIFTGTVKHNPYQEIDDEVLVMLDYYDNVPEKDRIAYSYDPRDLTLITNISDEKKGNAMAMFKTSDRITIDKSLKYTKKRFGTSEDMEKFFRGTIVKVFNNSATVRLDDSDRDCVWTYDLNDLTLDLAIPTPTSVKTSKETTTVTFSDGSTTSVKKSAGDPYDLETAIAYCIAKKFTTNSHIKYLAKTAEEVIDKVNTEFYNKFLKPYGFLNESAYSDVEIETLKDYLKTLNDIRSDLALIAIENDLTKDELLNKLKG